MGKVFIIAEAGVNHNGNIDTAKKLIDVAVDCGCDAVKFQTFKAEKLVTVNASKAEYQIANTGSDKSQLEMLKSLELSCEDHIELFEYCKHRRIMFLSTPFDEDSLELLESLGVAFFKIPSGEITNKPFLKSVARKQKPIILSTGMATLGEIEEALNWIYFEGNDNVTLLHCTSNYPTLINDVNLRVMLTLKEAFKVKVGYSDHTIGIEIAIAAAALGAEVIEKHFTLDKNMEGPDHKASLEPQDLLKMVASIRNIENAFGDGIKRVSSSELSTREVARKSIAAKSFIKKGIKINEDMLATKRPGTGIPPKYLEFVLGKTAARDICCDEIMEFFDIC